MVHPLKNATETRVMSIRNREKSGHGISVFWNFYLMGRNLRNLLNTVPDSPVLGKFKMVCHIHIPKHAKSETWSRNNPWKVYPKLQVKPFTADTLITLLQVWCAILWNSMWLNCAPTSALELHTSKKGTSDQILFLDEDLEGFKTWRFDANLPILIIWWFVASTTLLSTMLLLLY